MIRAAIKQFGIKMPRRARYRACPVCGEPCTAREFRSSNRNPKQNLICWQCRRNPAAEKDYFGKKPLDLKSRSQSVFRKQFWAIARIVRKNSKRKEVLEMSVNRQAINLVRFPERVAAVVGKTYAIMGDDFKLSDDEALTRIRDLLEELDGTLIERNKKKRLSRIS